MVESEMICHIDIPPVPPTLPAGHVPAVSPLHTLPQFCDKGGKYHTVPSLPLPKSHQRLATHSYGKTFPHMMYGIMWTLPSALVFAISSALWQTTSPRDTLLVWSLPPMVPGKSGIHYAGMWTSTSYSYHTWSWSPSSTPLQGNTDLGKSPQADIKYNTACLRMP